VPLRSEGHQNPGFLSQRARLSKKPWLNLAPKFLLFWETYIPTKGLF